MLRKFLGSKQYLPVLFSLGLAFFLIYDCTLRTLPSLVGVGVAEAYGLSARSYGLLCACFYLFYVPFQFVLGILIDRFKLTYLLAISLLICATGSYLFANAVDFWLALLARILMGVGAGSIFIILLKSISLRFSLERFTFYFTLMISFGMIGEVLLHMLLLFVETHWGWRLTCYLLSFFGIVLVAFNLIDFKGPSKVLPNTSRRWFWEELIEFKRILLNRTLWVQCMIGALLYLPVVGFAESWGGRYLKHMDQFSHAAAILDASMVFLGFAIGAPLVGWLYTYTRQYQLILTCGAIGVTTLLSIVLYVPALSIVDFGVFLFLLGVFSSTSVLVFSLNRSMVNKQNAGKVFAMTNFVMMISGFSAWMMGSFLSQIEQSSLHLLLASYSISSYQLAFVVLPLGSLLAVFLTFYVRER